MLRLVFVLLISIIGLMGCKRKKNAAKSIFYATKNAPKFIKEDVSEETAIVLKSSKCEDLNQYQCYEAEVLVPEESTDFFIVMPHALPKMLELDQLDYLSLHVTFFQLPDTTLAAEPINYKYHLGQLESQP